MPGSKNLIYFFQRIFELFLIKIEPTNSKDISNTPGWCYDNTLEVYVSVLTNQRGFYHFSWGQSDVCDAKYVCKFGPLYTFNANKIQVFLKHHKSCKNSLIQFSLIIQYKHFLNNLLKSFKSGLLWCNKFVFLLVIRKSCIFK